MQTFKTKFQLTREIIRSNHWFLLFFLTNCFFIFIIWLTGTEKFVILSQTIILFTLLTLSIGIILEHIRLAKLQKIMTEFVLHSNDKQIQHQIRKLSVSSWHPVLSLIEKEAVTQKQLLNERVLELKNYQDFIEAWTHEIKTPLSLATLVLENHKDEMSPYVYARMNHVRFTIQSDVERILYYARLQYDHVDFHFEKIVLGDIVDNVLEHFQGIIAEKHIIIEQKIAPLLVTSDRKSLQFILSQLLSNALKYVAKTAPQITITAWEDCDPTGSIYLSTLDNGHGVRPEDAPFIFDKGFTGTHPGRQNATGMGLYLVQKYAEHLAIKPELDSISTTGAGFGITLIFPKVD